MNNASFRFYLNGKTLVSIFQGYLFRLVRFVFHFFQWLPPVRKNHLPSKSIVEWVIDLVFYVLDLLLIPDFLELIFVWTHPKIRLLNAEEKALATKYFSNNVKLNNVRIRHHIPKMIRRSVIAFVSFNTIHFSRSISNPIFIHEIVHIWQYQKFGSVYIYRALKAQRSKEGYNYGGLENLYHKMLNNHFFTDFNFEQQGQIFEDYCKIKESKIELNPIGHASFEYFISQVRDSEIKSIA